MKVARFIDVGKIEISEENIPKPKPDEITIKVMNSGICGTDFHIYQGEVKGLVEPGVVLGHEFAGIVEKIGSNITKFNIGDKVAVEPNLFCGSCHYCRNAKKHFCENWKAIGLSRDGGFQEYCSFPATAAYKMPEGLEFKNAAFFEPMACVLHGIERSKLNPGETVIVQGCGSIGLLYIQALKKLGATSIIVSDIDSQKLSLAKKLGATTIVNVNNENLLEVVKSETNNIGAQILIDAAGLLNTIPSSFQLLENTGRVVIFGVPPENKSVEIKPYEIYRREIEIIGSFTNPYTNEAALKMLKDIEVDSLITNAIKLEDIIDKGMRKFGNKGVIKIQIQF